MNLLPGNSLAFLSQKNPQSGTETGSRALSADGSAAPGGVRGAVEAVGLREAHSLTAKKTCLRPKKRAEKKRLTEGPGGKLHGGFSFFWEGHEGGHGEAGGGRVRGAWLFFFQMASPFKSQEFSLFSIASGFYVCLDLASASVLKAYWFELPGPLSRWLWF